MRKKKRTHRNFRGSTRPKNVLVVEKGGEVETKTQSGVEYPLKGAEEWRILLTDLARTTLMLCRFRTFLGDRSTLAAEKPTSRATHPHSARGEAAPKYRQRRTEAVV